VAETACGEEKVCCPVPAGIEGDYGMLKQRVTASVLLRLCLCWCFLFLFLVIRVHGNPSEVRILHVNDFHGFAVEHRVFGSEDPVGGIQYLVGLVEKLRKERPSLLLAAGDMIQGNNWANLSKGRSVIELMNAMRFDAMVVGNHEFDFGQEVLQERISEAQFPVLGANVEGLGRVIPYTIKEIEGLKVGIIGIVSEETPVTTHPGNVRGLSFLPSAETAERYVRALRGKTDLIVLLSHMGLSRDLAIADKVKGIDVIVGGHSHAKVDKYLSVGNTVIVQAFEHGEALGVLDLGLKNGKIATIASRLERIRPDQDVKSIAVAAIVEKYSREADALMNEVIGITDVELDGKNVRTRETNLGDFIADTLREVSSADVTITNGGGMRASIKQGRIRISDVYSVLPFDNYVVAVRLTGRQIREVLEHGVSAVEDEEGRFPQVSGLTFVYDPSAAKGTRVADIVIGGKPIMDDREYTVATNDFLAAGGDGYGTFGDAAESSRGFSVIGGAMTGDRLSYSDPGRWLRDVVADSIRKKGKIAPAVEGRIREIRQP
jgi:5'-nucleotidase / UDP-sugar diphosphatase